MALILASSSPRRQALLTMLGLSYTVRTAGIDETMDPRRGAEAEVSRICRAKADAVLPELEPEDVVIAADTVVCLDGRILGKPKSPKEARAMLTALSGRTHQVRTGVTVCTKTRALTEVDLTGVTFRPLSEAEIAAYVEGGEPMDKAGAYGAQGLGSIFVERLDGDYFNVMGLPLCRLSRMLERFGIAILGGVGERGTL